MSHKCPGTDCERQVPAAQLACPTHWFKVSLTTRNRVWRAYRTGSTDHLEAVSQAIEEMNRAV